MTIYHDGCIVCGAGDSQQHYADCPYSGKAYLLPSLLRPPVVAKAPPFDAANPPKVNKPGARHD